MGDVTKKLLEDGIAAFVTPFDQLIAGVESSKEAAVTGRPSTMESSLPDQPGGAAGQARGARRGRGRGAQGLEQGRDAVGRPRPGDRRPAGLAHDRRPDAGAGRRPGGLRRRGQVGRHDRRRAAGHGRVEPRAGGHPPQLRRRGRADPARAGLHRPGRGAGAGALAGPVEDAVHRVVEVRRDGGDPLPHAPLLRAHRRQRATSSWP